MAQAGLITPGNIDLESRPRVKNPDGSISTVRSISINVDGREILIPTVVNGKVVSNDEAIRQFERTGQHLGVFADEPSATAYAQSLHEREAQKLMSKPTLAQMVRAKYPGVYDDLSDAELESKVKAKYPGVYDDLPTTQSVGVMVNGRPMSIDDYNETQQARTLKPNPNPSRQTPSLREMSNAAELPGTIALLRPYMNAGPIRMVEGVQDLQRGHLAKGAHEILAGSSVAAAPVALPYGLVTAPAATVGALTAGAAADTTGRVVAGAFGASPDQIDLAGDVAGIGGGIVGAKAGSTLGAQLVELLKSKNVTSAARTAAQGSQMVRHPIRTAADVAANEILKRTQPPHPASPAPPPAAAPQPPATPPPAPAAPAAAPVIAPPAADVLPPTPAPVTPAIEPWDPRTLPPDPHKQTAAFRRGVDAMMARRGLRPDGTPMSAEEVAAWAAENRRMLGFGPTTAAAGADTPPARTARAKPTGPTPTRGRARPTGPKPSAPATPAADVTLPDDEAIRLADALAEAIHDLNPTPLEQMEVSTLAARGMAPEAIRTQLLYYRYTLAKGQAPSLEAVADDVGHFKATGRSRPSVGPQKVTK